MNSTSKPLILAAVIFAILVVAFVAVLYVFEIGSPEELRDSLTKILISIGIVLAASLIIWGVLKLVKRE